MKTILVVIIQVSGFAFTVIGIFTFLNYFFGWRLGLKGIEAPNELKYAILFSILAIIISPAGWFLRKRFKV